MLRELHLEAFKCFERLDLPLAPLTLLSGVNGGGKSSVIQALVLLAQTISEREWGRTLMLEGPDLALGSAADVLNQKSARRKLVLGAATSGERVEWSFRADDRRALSVDLDAVAIDGKPTDLSAGVRWLLPVSHAEGSKVGALLRRLSWITAERTGPRELLPLRDAQGHPLFWDDAAEDHLAPALRHAIGGALGRAGEVMAWYAPTVNSYRRLRSQDAAGWGTTWGMDHRFCSVRVIGHHPNDLRLEFRLPGADANPYLVLTALLASVRDGLTRASDPGPATTGNPYDHPAGGPQHLGEAVAAFASSAFARATFADQVVDHYATLGRFEWDRFLDSVTDWERERYFELI